MKKPYIHSNTPRRLAAAYHFARNTRGEGFKIHVLADTLKVNVRYIHDLIVKGIEPNDITEKLRAVRKAMFLPARKRKAKHEREFDKAIEKIFEPEPEHRKWWRRLKKQERDTWIQSSYEVHRQRRW
jgi:hypothetical protein